MPQGRSQASNTALSNAPMIHAAREPKPRQNDTAKYDKAKYDKAKNGKAKKKKASKQARSRGMEQPAAKRSRKKRSAARGTSSAESLGTCRLCQSERTLSFMDLGMVPVSARAVPAAELAAATLYHPLHAVVCSNCFLIQLKDLLPEELRARSAALQRRPSQKWRASSQRLYRELAQRMQLGSNSLVLSLSDSGESLGLFQKLSVPILSIDAVERTAQEAIRSGIPTRVDRITAKLAQDLARRGTLADIVIASNVVNRAADINDVIASIAVMLKPRGTAIIDFPHVERLIQDTNFDAISHAEVNYLSLTTLERLAARHKLKVTDVHEIADGNDSLRALLAHSSSAEPLRHSVARILSRERKAGLSDMQPYARFSAHAKKLKFKLLSFLVASRNAGQRLCIYGNSSDMGTLVHYAGIDRDFIEIIADPESQHGGLFMPGKLIPIGSLEALRTLKPDVVLVHPYACTGEHRRLQEIVGEWGGKLLVAHPDVIILSQRS